MGDNGDGLAVVREPGTTGAGPGHDPGRDGFSATPGAPRRAEPPAQPRLGEELPIFCERCGYSLNGLPQLRCDACAVLHFSCPECDHHQPINTLRPAVQRALGRLRALGLALIVFLKINYFGWTLFAWGVAGTAISYRYDWTNNAAGGFSNYRLVEPRFEEEGVAVLLCFGLGFGMVARMLLLRWRSGALVGLGLAGLVVAAWYLGAFFRRWEANVPSDHPFNGTVLTYVASAAAGTLAGAACAWGLWLSLTHAFLPKRAAAALLEWQRAMSAPSGDAPAARTDATTSVTV